jgi:acyl-CoA synthetase (AMP-forming)/AMP-acid ligase II
MRRDENRSLWDLTAQAGLSPGRFVGDASAGLVLAELRDGRHIDAAAEALRGKSVLISCERQLPAVLALLRLDGVSRRILLCPPDLPPAHLPAVMAAAEVDAIVSDSSFSCPAAPAPGPIRQTEWVLFTSGTTGQPKLVVHSLASLAGPLVDGIGVASDAVWSTFYDVRRYGGLTILLRALLGGGSMVLSQNDETVAAFLARAGRAGVTHMSGTPSHWRRALMSEAAGHIAPRYVRLSGEVADQAILDQLEAAFPAAEIAHAFASTEAGFAFDVRDGRAGFPAAVIDQAGGGVDLRIINGSLCIRSGRAACRYLGGHGPLADASGFIDTDDMLERRGDRYHFVGRRSGVINVGGRKVHPEEVEAVINQHPDVRMARVRGRPSPITGALVVADIVVRPGAAADFQAVKGSILALCRDRLDSYKVPALLHQVASLEIAQSGKLARRDA